MRIAERLIEKIVEASGIPSASRRREVARELHSHVEDFVQQARSAGHADEEIEEMVRTNFGNPLQVGENFSWVYRRERALLHLFVFGLVTFVVAAASVAGTIVLQAGLAAAAFGVPVMATLGSDHTLVESRNILAMVACYAALVALEGSFMSQRFAKGAGVLGLLVVALWGYAHSAGIQAPYMLIGLAKAVFVRTIQVVPISPIGRFAAAVVGFELFGLSLWARMPGTAYRFTPVFASWFVMGLGYQTLAVIAPLADRALFRRFQLLR